MDQGSADSSAAGSMDGNMLQRYRQDGYASRLEDPRCAAGWAFTGRRFRPARGPVLNGSFRVDGGRHALAGWFSPGSGVNGDITARLLGVRPAVLANVELTAGTDNAATPYMNTALWAATWGYFMEQRLTGAVSADGLRQFRRHFIDHIRPGGPLPTLRVGNQPYGLLPVTSLDRFVPNGAADVGARAVQTLQSLLIPFRAAVNNAARMGDTTPGTRTITSRSSERL
jgi:hypothetical protein